MLALGSCREHAGTFPGDAPGLQSGVHRAGDNDRAAARGPRPMVDSGVRMAFLPD